MPWIMSRYFVGAVGSALVALSAFYVASFLDSSLGLLGAAAALVVGIVVVVGSARATSPAALAPFRQVAMAVALFALTAPILLYAFSHLTLDRYLWVIAQPGLCSHLGSAAVTFTSAVIGWSMASGLLGVLVATRRGDAPLFPRGGTLLAGSLIVLGVLVVVIAPAVAASWLGCGR
jgi:hypothetical protein